eukprot:7337194-Lingulodinium_polyedra.AAC.1
MRWSTHGARASRNVRRRSKCAQRRIPLPRCRTFRNARVPCVGHRVAVGAWIARIAECAAPRRYNAFLNAFL